MDKSIVSPFFDSRCISLNAFREASKAVLGFSFPSSINSLDPPLVMMIGPTVMRTRVKKIIYA